MKICLSCERCFEDEIVSCAEENHQPLIAGRTGSREIIAGYRLDFLCESSAAGETYLAFNQSLEKNRLIKIIPPELFDGEDGELFLRETQALSAIFHPNLARVYESGRLADGSLYAVTEFFTAETLRESLEESGIPLEINALTIVRQVAEGLNALHEIGVLHRNIRLENIILTTDAENQLLAKIQNVDFGGIHQKIIRSRMGQNLPYLKYFSPEQCAGQPVEAQTDVYSLGVVLYETLAGQAPFDAPEADALVNRQINENPPPVSIKNFNIRMLLTETLTESLQKTKRLRLKTANIFARRLRHLEQIITHSPTPPPAVSSPVKPEKPRTVVTPPKFENPVPLENKVVISAEDELSVPPAVDLTTNKLPPIKMLIGDSLSANNLPAADAEIQNIEWEQPDDIPPMPKIAEIEAKQTELILADDFIDYEDSVINLGEIDLTIDYLPKVSEEGKGQPILAYFTDSVASWNLPEKRKILSGAGIAALLVVAFSGVFLNRQVQTEDNPRQTLVQSSPQHKSLPKSDQAENLSASDSSSVGEMPDLPDYQPSEAVEKNQSPVLPVRHKKQAKPTTEIRNQPKPNEAVANETALNKKGEAETKDNRTVVKSEPPQTAETDFQTRPRIVKKLNTARIIP